MASWIDVCAFQGDFLTAESEPGFVVLKFKRQVIASVAVPTDFLRWPRVAGSPQGRIAVIGQGGEGEAWLVQFPIVGMPSVGTIGPTFGQNPVAVRYEGEILHTYRCAPGDFVPLFINNERVGQMNAVEGIREVLPDGTIVHAKATAADVFSGHNFGQYTYKDGWVVGQSGFTISALSPQNEFFTVRKGSMAEGIHFATIGSRIVVVALTENGAFAAEFSPPYPVGQSEPFPDPIPEPQPKPKPEPKPMQKPENDGVENGLVVNPKNFFLTLVWDKDPRQYVAVLNSLRGKLWGAGIGIQTDSAGTPRGRLYLPTPICPDASPRTPAEQQLGVRQDERCWDQLGRFVDVVENDASGNPIGWTWAERGAQPYQPFGSQPTEPEPTEPKPQPQVPDFVLRDIAELKREVGLLKGREVRLSRDIASMGNDLTQFLDNPLVKWLLEFAAAWGEGRVRTDERRIALNHDHAVTIKAKE